MNKLLIIAMVGAVTMSGVAIGQAGDTLVLDAENLSASSSSDVNVLGTGVAVSQSWTFDANNDVTGCTLDFGTAIVPSGNQVKCKVSGDGGAIIATACSDADGTATSYAKTFTGGTIGAETIHDVRAEILEGTC